MLLEGPTLSALKEHISHHVTHMGNLALQDDVEQTEMEHL